MALYNYKQILEYAKERKFTVGAFNSMNMETVQAAASAADKKKVPLIIQTYHAHVDYAGADYIRAICNVAAKNSGVMLAMGLDHGRNFEQAKLCIDEKFSGVMIDLASEDYELNVRETCRVVEIAHAKGVSVEAELGTIVTADSTPEQIAKGYTDPEIARRFVKETGIDCLAVSIGTAHGMYKYDPVINFGLLQELIETADCPIVVHGGSNTPDEDILKMVKLGIAKLNIGTDFFRAYNQAMYQVLKEKGAETDIVEIMSAARSAVERTAMKKIDLLTAYRI